MLNSDRRARVFSCRVCSVEVPSASRWMTRTLRGVVEVLGYDGDKGGIRGDPPIGRYLGVEFSAVGLNRGDDGKDRTPEPLTPGLLSMMDKNARELDEL